MVDPFVFSASFLGVDPINSFPNSISISSSSSSSSSGREDHHDGMLLWTSESSRRPIVAAARSCFNRTFQSQHLFQHSQCTSTSTRLHRYIHLLFHILTNIWMYQLLAKNGGIVTRRWNANARAQPRSGSWLARWGQRGRSRGSSRGCRKRSSSSPGQQVKSEPCMQLLAAVACWHLFGSPCDANGNQAV